MEGLLDGCVQQPASCHRVIRTTSHFSLRLSCSLVHSAGKCNVRRAALARFMHSPIHTSPVPRSAPRGVRCLIHNKSLKRHPRLCKCGLNNRISTRSNKMVTAHTDTLEPVSTYTQLCGYGMSTGPVEDLSLCWLCYQLPALSQTPKNNKVHEASECIDIMLVLLRSRLLNTMEVLTA